MAFDKVRQLGELKKMRSQALALQKELEQITETVEDRDIKVVVTGDQKVSYIEIGGIDQERLLKVINKAMKRVQKKAAKKMMEMGGGLSSLLGG